MSVHGFNTRTLLLLLVADGRDVVMNSLVCTPLLLSLGPSSGLILTGAVEQENLDNNSVSVS